MATLLGVVFLWALRTAAVLVALSLALSAALGPIVDQLVQRGWWRRSALAAVYVATIVDLSVPAYVLGSQSLAEVPRAATELAAGYEEIVAKWPRGGSFRAFVAEHVPPSSQIYK